MYMYSTYCSSKHTCTCTGIINVHTVSDSWVLMVALLWLLFGVCFFHVVVARHMRRDGQPCTCILLDC